MLKLQLCGQGEIVGGSGKFFGGSHGNQGCFSLRYSFVPAMRIVVGSDYGLKRCAQLLRC
jgi:hypothetical protein